nr:hypothetical protein HmN_000220100 [Hymenolepis microstoma]
MYKDTPLEQINEFTYLGMTFDTKLTWKHHIAKIAERASNRLKVLKHPAGSATLNTTYKMFVQPIMLYCCDTLVTASEAILKPLEKMHNQAWGLITRGIKSTPIDAMFLATRYSKIRSFIEEKALTLYEKRLRIPSDTFWSTRTKEKQWTAALSNMADWPKLEAIAEFRLRTGHDCLAKHLHRIGVYVQPTCPPCDLQEEMEKTI